MPRGLYILVESSKFTQIQSFKQAFRGNVESFFVERPRLSGFCSPSLLSMAPGQCMWGGAYGPGREADDTDGSSALQLAFAWTVTTVMGLFLALVFSGVCC